MKKSFNIQELLHRKSKHHGTTKPMHPSLLRAFQRHQEHDLKHPSLVDLITTKQNKPPFFIDRFGALIVPSLEISQHNFDFYVTEYRNLDNHLHWLIFCHEFLHVLDVSLTKLFSVWVVSNFPPNSSIVHEVDFTPKCILSRDQNRILSYQWSCTILKTIFKLVGSFTN